MLGRVAGALSSGVAVFGAWFGHRGKRVRIAWVTNLPPLGNFVTHAARNDRGRLTLSLGDSNHARGKRATALRAPTSPHSPQSNSRPHRAQQPPWELELERAPAGQRAPERDLVGVLEVA